MKKLKLLFVLNLFMFFTLSCERDNINLESNSINKNNTISVERVSSTSRKNYSPNQLVIEFASYTTDSQKNALRSYYGVLEYKLCQHCADNAIELWFFENGIEIEPKKTTIEDPPVGGVHYPLIINVDFEYFLSTSSTISSNDLSSNLSSNYQQYIKNNNDGITIAVFDTGIIPSIGGNNPVFQNQFLYNASNDGIPGIYSGWDFVNHDNDCDDDNTGMHGTIVTSIITDILNDNQNPVPHQILPLKICDSEGKASYFNLLCAMSYALERADILQMSLGWYDNNSGDLVDNIFSDLLNAYPNAIVVNSAGNDTNNNDLNIHCPSGYSLNNIISIASCNEFALQENPLYPANISDFSNFGLNSVDFFANGENIYFQGNSFSGTSFAAPVVTALIAREKKMNPNISPNQIINNLIDIGLTCQGSFNPYRKVQYNKILIP